jgi:ribose transport system substrate-binding protein
MKRSTLRTTIAAVLAATLLSSACSSASGGGTGHKSNEITKQADAALQKIASGAVLSKGPHGETAAPASAVTLTPAEIAAVKAKHATAAIVMHYGGNDWAVAQIAGLKKEFATLGIQVIASTDANFDPGKQVSDIETVMARHPDIIVSIPTDPVATAAAYKKAAAAGVKLVFMDNVPNGMTAGHGYVSVVSADNYGNGVVAAHEMAKAIGGKGKIGAIFHDADFFVTKQRYQGFTDTIKADYPDIHIVQSTGIAGPDFAGDAQKAADAMLTQHPDLTGIWAVWDVPAEGVMAAARADGRRDLAIATEDLGTNVAIALAKDSLIAGLGAQRPFDQGTAEAKLAAYGVLGKTAPAYVALNALPVDHSNVLQAWTQIYHASAPPAIAKSYKK